MHSTAKELTNVNENGFSECEDVKRKWPYKNVVCAHFELAQRCVLPLCLCVGLDRCI